MIEIVGTIVAGLVCAALIGAIAYADHRGWL
jgi:hypothetical protein